MGVLVKKMRFNMCPTMWKICTLCTCFMGFLTFFTMAAKIPCDVDSKTNTCPVGQCCVRNTTDFTDNYCQPLGAQGSICATYTSKYVCHCGDKLFCEKTTNGSNFGNCKPKIVDIPCNLTARNDSCPAGMCCVRDEFLFSYTYCKALGVEGSSCVTHPSYFECPCRDGYNCDSNLQGGHHSSLFGSCKPLATAPGTTPSAGSTPSPGVTTEETLDRFTGVTDQTTDAPNEQYTTAPPAKQANTMFAGMPAPVG